MNATIVLSAVIFGTRSLCKSCAFRTLCHRYRSSSGIIAILSIAACCCDITVAIGNWSVPKIIRNDTINLFFKPAISILVISNRKSFRVLFDKIAFIYFIWKIHIFYFSIRNGKPREPAVCQLTSLHRASWGLAHPPALHTDVTAILIVV